MRAIQLQRAFGLLQGVVIDGCSGIKTEIAADSVG
jgi:hypothetical protein